MLRSGGAASSDRRRTSAELVSLRGAAWTPATNEMCPERFGNLQPTRHTTSDWSNPVLNEALPEADRV